MSINLTTTHTKHKPIYIYTYRQKPLKLLKIKKGPIDKTFHKTSGFDRITFVRGRHRKSYLTRCLFDFGQQQYVVKQKHVHVHRFGYFCFSTHRQQHTGYADFDHSLLLRMLTKGKTLLSSNNQ